MPVLTHHTFGLDPITEAAINPFVRDLRTFAM